MSATRLLHRIPHSVELTSLCRIDVLDIL